MSEPINIFDFEKRAQACLQKNTCDYYASGAHDEITTQENHTAYDRLRLQYRVLVDVSERTTKTTVAGHELAMPVMIAPTAFHRLACEDGELATAGAAERAGTVMILSSLSNTDIEAVIDATEAPVWFQLYVYRDRPATEALVRRAEAAGAQALVLTVDAPRLGSRERDVRNHFHLPDGLEVKNLVASGYGEVARQQMSESGLAAYFASLIDPSLSWRDIAWLRSITKLPIWIKGIVRADDAQRAVDYGAAGVVVSNHGGRQLDTAVATIEALPMIADAVDGRIPILIDGGIRRGTDVLKAVALGADAVLLGRPILWGLAAGGRRAAARVLELLRREFDLAMALAGCASVEDITRDLVAR